MEKEYVSPQIHYSISPDLAIGDRDLNQSNGAASTSIYQELSHLINVKRMLAPPSIIQPLDLSTNRIMKRALDILFSLVVIIGLLSWLTPIIALLIKLDSRGPVFFLQNRNKKNGVLFTCIKFRSMNVNEEADILPAHMNDKRITRIGRFLRNNYLDELPQFLNVLWGDMSVVGPRPHMISDNIRFEEVVDYYSSRHDVKPGITGLAQVLGYLGPTPDIQKMKNRVSIDIFYVRHWSLVLDVMILYRTFRRIVGL